MSAVPRLYTDADLEQMPDDGVRREIIAGDLLVTPAPRFEHQIVLANLHELLVAYLAARGEFRVFESPVDLFVSRHDVVQPDLIVVPHAAVARFRRAGHVDAPPVLVVEVTSPRTARVDRREKPALYRRFGVQEYWIVDPSARTFEVFARDPDTGALERLEASGIQHSSVFSDFALTPDEIFRDL